MATTTGARLREIMARGLGFFFEGTATGGSTSTIADTSTDGFDKLDVNRVAGKWAYITAASGAAPEFEERKVASVATTTITVDTNYSAVVASGDTYELLPYRRNDMDDAIQRAIRVVYPDLFLSLRDETLIVDDLLSNSDFETFSGTFTSWTHAVGTWTQETGIIRHGSNSAKGVASGAAAQLTQVPQINSKEMTTKTANFARWVYATVASTARIRIDWDGSSIESHAYHSGADQWEYQRITVQIPSTATQVKAICEVADGGTAYFDAPGGLWIGNLVRYTIPTSFVSGPGQVLQQYQEAEPDGEYLRVAATNRPLPGHFLRLVGMGRLTVPTTDAATAEIDETQAELITSKACVILFQRLKQLDPTMREIYSELQMDWQREVVDLMRRPGIRMRPLPAYSPNGAYTFSADSSGRYLQLTR
jgi:hypothetical protein